jgi:hypothetical protein
MRTALDGLARKGQRRSPTENGRASSSEVSAALLNVQDLGPPPRMHEGVPAVRVRVKRADGNLSQIRQRVEMPCRQA